MSGSKPLLLGRLVATRNASETIPSGIIAEAIARHRTGDWGEVCEGDRELNDWSRENGERILSAYRTPAGTRFWIITEADRSSTTVLLPQDY